MRRFSRHTIKSVPLTEVPILLQGGLFLKRRVFLHRCAPMAQRKAGTAKKRCRLFFISARVTRPPPLWKRIGKAEGSFFVFHDTQRAYHAVLNEGLISRASEGLPPQPTGRHGGTSRRECEARSSLQARGIPYREPPARAQEGSRRPHPR